MKLSRFTPFSLVFYLISCQTPIETEVTAEPKTPVEVVHIKTGEITDDLPLMGNTVYLKRNSVTAPIPSFITKVNVKLGDKVYKGQLLYVLESKESRALGNALNAMDSSFSKMGIVRVKATASGIISTFDQQQEGAYVLEGTQLCTIAESNDLVFQINVPYEYIYYTKIGSTCTILLPNDERFTAKFTRALTTMNATNQTQTFLVKATKNMTLPENMIVEAIIHKSGKEPKQLLPKTCVLSDAMMREFWVMQLINDSTAIKTAVEIGNKNTAEIEILKPKFEPEDRIISIGNYGLADTALVTLTNEAK